MSEVRNYNKFKIILGNAPRNSENGLIEGLGNIPNVTAEDLEMFQTLQRVGFISNPERTAHLKSKLHKRVIEYGQFTRGTVKSSVFRGIGEEVKGKKVKSPSPYQNLLRSISSVTEPQIIKFSNYVHSILFLTFYFAEFLLNGYILFLCNMFEASTFRVLVPLIALIFGLQIMMYLILNHKSSTSFAMILVCFMLLWLLEIASGVFLFQNLFGIYSHGMQSMYSDNPCERRYEVVYISCSIVDAIYPTIHLVILILLDRKEK